MGQRGHQDPINPVCVRCVYGGVKVNVAGKGNRQAEMAGNMAKWQWACVQSHIGRWQCKGPQPSKGKEIRPGKGV